MSRTLILVKPDAFARNLTGEIIARFERKGLRIAALRHMTLDRQTAEQHYAEHDGKPFFEELVSFITSGPLVAMVLEGEHAVKAARQVIGATNPLEAAPGSIRGDFAVEVGQNMVHGSDSDESAEREANLFFPRPDPRVRVAAAAGDPGAGGRGRSRSRPPAWTSWPSGEPRAVAAENARRKALAVRPATLVLGADTLVGVDGDILGKPRDAAQAAEYVGRLAGRTHEVVGGIALARDGAVIAEAVEVTRCVPRAHAAEVDAYVALGGSGGEWEGRAGGYAIQGRGRGARPADRRRLPQRGRAAARTPARLLPHAGLQRIFGR